MYRRLSVYLLSCALLLTATGLLAQSADEPSVRLSLLDCLRTALDNNLDLVSARKDPEISEQLTEVEAANFDGAIQIAGSTTETVQTPFDPTQPSGRSTSLVSTTWSQNLGIGGDYSASLFYQEDDAPTFNVINPFEVAGLDLRFTLPLLNGLGKETTQEQLLLARGNLDISREELRRQAELTIETVEGAYWTVVARNLGRFFKRQ